MHQAVVSLSAVELLRSPSAGLSDEGAGADVEEEMPEWFISWCGDFDWEAFTGEVNLVIPFFSFPVVLDLTEA